MITIKSLEVKEIEYSYETRPKIMGFVDVVKNAAPMIAYPNKEFFISFYLNTKNGILRQDIISIGSLNANIVHPREIFKTACILSAANIIVVHNHPSGDPEPSNEDIEITRKLVESGKMIGIKIIDLVILGHTNYSFKEMGRM